VPVVRSISPTSLVAGATNQAITITGSGFTSTLFGTGSGATASFGAGVTVLSLSRNSDTQLTARITVSPTATPGSRDVQVTGRGGLSSVLSGGFTVNPRPTITSLSPTSLRRTGLAQTLTINGTGFASGARVTFSGSGIRVNSTTVNSSTRITVSITISTSAATGNRTVTVTNSNGSATAPATFLVTT
jgi:uncharacterized membrane protein